QAAQYGKTPLLVLVEAIIERPRRIRQFLERRAGFRQRSRPLLQALDRIRGAGPAAASRVDPGVEAIKAQLLVVPGRLFESRPILFLVRREREAGLECREPRVSECAHVHARLPPSRAVRTVLRQDEARTSNHE